MPENLLIDASIRQYEESVRLDIEGWIDEGLSRK
jgi:hypothetical protein